MYGKRKYSKGYASRRTSGTFGSRRRYALKKVVRRYVKKRIAKRLSRREIKIDDDFFALRSWQKYNNGAAGTTGYVNFVLGGIVSRSYTLEAGKIGDPNSGGDFVVKGVHEAYSPNCLTNVDSGTTAKTRIGNMIQPRYLTLKGVIGAATTTDPLDPETLAKTEVGDALKFIERYVRTSVKVFVIRDKSMNEKGFIEYSDVFESPTGEGGSGINAPFLWNRKIDTMSRYEILREQEYQLDADDPQKSFTWVVPLKGVAIRFNGASNSVYNGVKEGQYGTIVGSAPNGWTVTPGVTPVTAVSIKFSTESQSMTNGVYVLAAAHCMNNNGGNGDFYGSPSVVFSSRLTFED